MRRFFSLALSFLKYALMFLAIAWAVNAWRTRDVPVLSPNFSAPMLDGSRFDLQAVRAAHPNQPIALLFWASWCPICKTEAHSIERLSRDKNLLFFTIATQSGDATQVKNELTQRGHNWNMLLDESGDLLNAYQLKGVPTLVILDGKNRIDSVQTGYTSELGMRFRYGWAGF